MADASLSPAAVAEIAATERRVLDMIRANHLKANIGGYEKGHPDGAVIHWDRAWIDPGGTIFGPGPYAKVPIDFTEYPGGGWEIVVRVYPPERLRKRLAKMLAPPDHQEG